MTRLTIKSMIEEDLGYCCEWFFFSQFKRTTVIAERLGVTPRSIRYHKEDFREDRLPCSGKGDCMKVKLGK